MNVAAASLQNPGAAFFTYDTLRKLPSGIVDDVMFANTQQQCAMRKRHIPVLILTQQGSTDFTRRRTLQLTHENAEPSRGGVWHIHRVA